MSVIASINFKKSNVIQTRHNDRTLAPSYLISDSGCKCNRSHEIAIKLKKQIIENAKEAYKTSCKARNKKFQATSYEWSAVCNIKSNTTMQDLENLAKHFEDKYGFQCYQIAIHRDEGHIDDNGNKAINHHAHLEFITLDKATGKNCFKLRDFPKSKMREIQDEVAEILKMERGVDKRISKRERIEPRKYAQMKEAERKKTKKLKTRLENLEEENKDLNRENNDFYYKNIDLEDVIQAKNQEIQELEAKDQAIQELIQAKELESKEVEAYIEQFRKNCANKGLPKEFFRKISNLKKQAKPTIKELLDDTLNSLLQSYLKEKERNQELENENKALTAENETLTAKISNLTQNKYILTQDQIQEIINQALAQKEAEIEKKNQEISKLQAEKEQFQKLLETKNEVIQTQNPENTQTPNNEELTENNGKQATYFLNNFFKDDVSIFSKTNTDKTEVSRQDQEEDQTHNEDEEDLGIHKIIKKTTIKK